MSDSLIDILHWWGLNRSKLVCEFCSSWGGLFSYSLPYSLYFQQNCKILSSAKISMTAMKKLQVKRIEKENRNRDRIWPANFLEQAPPARHFELSIHPNLPSNGQWPWIYEQKDGRLCKTGISDALSVFIETRKIGTKITKVRNWIQGRFWAFHLCFELPLYFVSKLGSLWTAGYGRIVTQILGKDFFI